MMFCLLNSCSFCTDSGVCPCVLIRKFSNYTSIHTGEVLYKGLYFLYSGTQKCVIINSTLKAPLEKNIIGVKRPMGETTHGPNDSPHKGKSTHP